MFSFFAAKSRLKAIHQKLVTLSLKCFINVNLVLDDFSDKFCFAITYRDILEQEDDIEEILFVYDFISKANKFT